MLFSNIAVIATAWGSGSGSGLSSDPSDPNYGTQDWLAEHALDWLPEVEKKYITDNLNEYLYGTELPDKPSSQTNGIGDFGNQHIYYNATGLLEFDNAADRAQEEYDDAKSYLMNGDYANAARRAGVMSHYITLVAMFGNVMNETYWGTPVNSSAYSDYVNSKMTSYNSAEFDSYLAFDGTLEKTLTAQLAALEVASDTTFDNQGDKTCKWMDDNYNWDNADFKNRAGTSLNFAVNLLADVLHKLYLDIPAPSMPIGLDAENPTGNSINLTWNANPEGNVIGYSIYMNDTDSDTDFHFLSNVSASSNEKFKVTGLENDVKYYFKIKAYNVVFKVSDFSNRASETTLDITPPKAPSLNTPPSVTNRVKLNISGYAEPYSEVEIFINGNLTDTIQAGEPLLGFFRVEIGLLEGVNNVTARATDEDGNTGPISKYVIIILDSIKPKANAGSDQLLKLGVDPITINLNGSSSTDVGTGIVNYTWRFPDYDLPVLYGKFPSFVVNSVGNYKIELEVEDQAKNLDTHITWVNVSTKDISPPKILNRVPEINETDVDVNVTITAQFNERLKESSLGIELIDVTNSKKITIGVSLSYLADTKTILVSILGNFSYNTTYSIEIIAEDLEGNPLTDGIWNFTTVLPPADSDFDGMPDSWEVLYGLNPSTNDAGLDLDEDGVSNLGEYNNGFNSTDPTDYDTDDDNIPDGWEYKYYLNPLDPSDAIQDPDGDDYTNFEEYLGLDGVEGGGDSTNPNDPNIYPGSESTKKDDEMDDWILYLTVVIVLIIILVILILSLRYYNKLRAEESAKKSKEKDDEYFKVENKDELGVGGELLALDDVEYYKRDRVFKPEKEIVSDKDMIDCPKCGAKLDVYTDYCYECGEVLKKKKDKKKEVKIKKKELDKLRSKKSKKPKKKSF